MNQYEYKSVFSSIYGKMLDWFGNGKSDIEISFRFYKQSLYETDNYLKIRIYLLDDGLPVMTDYIYISAGALHNTPNVDREILHELSVRIGYMRHKYRAVGGNQDA